MLSLIIYSSFIYESRRFEYRLSIGLDSFTGSRENKVTSTWIWNYSALFFLLLPALFWRASFFKNFRGYLCFKRMTYYFDYWYSHLMLKYFFLFLLFRDVWVKAVLIHCWEWNLQTSVWAFITFFFLSILDLHSAYVVKLWCCRIIHVVWTFFEATENILETLDSTPSPWSKVKENSKILWKSIKSLEFRRASFS